MRLTQLVSVVTVGVLSLLPSAVHAQSATAGAIAGIVRDTSGGVLPGVTVEAASPALIEKIRSVVTDDQGNYKIVDLRPGTYTVTFTLPGFATFKREGLELTTGFTATANADMRVGSLEETVVVTGASPVVDIQNVRTQSVHSRETLDALPTPKSITGLGQLTLGVVSNTDVGGTRGDATEHISIHGVNATDMKNKVDGMSVQNNSTTGGGQNKVYAPNMVAMQETTLELGGMSAESETGGIQMNHVPRDGGNTLSLYSALSFSNGAMTSDNITDSLRARGLRAVADIKEIYDYGIGFGGPLRRDRAWFYTAHRAWGTNSYQLNSYWNATQNTLLYTPDFNRPVWTAITERDHSLRVTWQLTPKMKLNMSESYQENCLRCGRGDDENNPASAAAIASFVATGTAIESAGTTFNKPLSVTQATVSYPRTNRLLFDVGFAYNYFGKQTPLMPGVTLDTIAVRELSTGFIYGSKISFPNTQSHSEKGQRGNQVNGRGSVSYVTGSHAFKGGMTYYLGFEHVDRFHIQSLSYNFRNRIPVSLTQYTSPITGDLRTRQLGYFVQDQWTINKLTLNLGARADTFDGIALEANVPAGRFVPARTYPRLDGIPAWRDISPRLGAAYDVFGNGRTAIKGYFGKYVFSMGIDFTDRNSPQQAISPSSDRNWNDANSNFVPDCDLTNFGANGECGPLANSRFGQNARTRVDGDELREGWGARQYNWQSAVLLQQELRPGVALNVGYYRTMFGNLTAVDNLAVAPQDFDPYCVTTPVDSSLPGGGGQRLCGLYNQNRATFGQVREEVKKASGFGDANAMVFTGVDIGINARLGNGMMVAGGVATGQTRTNTCDIVDSPGLGSGAQDARAGFCESLPSWGAGTQYKMNFVYPLPWGIQVAGNYQNLPGQPILASRTFTNAEIAPSLGRNLSACPADTGACTATVTVAMIPTDGDTQYEDRLQQVDLRISKGLKIGRTRLRGSFDLYNLFNVGTITGRSNTYGPAWGTVTSILPGRLMKVGGTIEF